MSTGPIVSIIVPVYNAENYVGRCIASIQRQTYSNLEIIIIDDGSTDNTGRICATISGKDDRVRYYYQDNQGVSTARNNGLKVVKGEYVVFVDADDQISENMVEYLLQAAENYSVDMVVCGYVIEKESENKIIRIDDKIILGNDNVFLYFCEHFLEAIASSVWGKLYKKELLKQTFDPSLSMGEDLLFNLKNLKTIEKVCAVSTPLYLYNQKNINSLVSNYKIEYFNQDVFVCEQWLEQCKSIGQDNKGKIYYHIARSLFVCILQIAKEISNKEQKVNAISNLWDKKVAEATTIVLSEFTTFQKGILYSFVKKQFAITSFLAGTYVNAKKILLPNNYRRKSQ